MCKCHNDMDAPEQTEIERQQNRAIGQFFCQAATQNIYQHYQDR